MVGLASIGLFLIACVLLVFLFFAVLQLALMASDTPAQKTTTGRLVAVMLSILVNVLLAACWWLGHGGIQ